MIKYSVNGIVCYASNTVVSTFKALSPIGNWTDSSNNCYNFACDIRNNQFAQPGVVGNRYPAGFTCGEFEVAAIADGLVAGVQLDQPCTCYTNGHIVALFVSSDDFHWYRLETDGTWSHKRGQRPATNREDFPPLHNEIIGTNLLAAFHGAYNFCGYMCVPPSADIGSVQVTNIRVSKVEMAAGGSLTVEAETAPSPRAQWVLLGEVSPVPSLWTSGSATITTNLSVAGDHVIVAAAGNEIMTTVTVVRAASVTASTNLVPVGSQVVFTGSTQPPNRYHLLEWTAGAATQTGGQLFTNQWDTFGNQFAVAQCGTSFATGTVTVVAVDTISSSTSTSSVASNVTFQATVTASGGEHLLFWTGGGDPASQSGGATFVTKWNSAGTYDVIVQCGTSSRTNRITIVP
jgi:hypothetical protein